MQRVFVRFLEESPARKKRFEIIWPLKINQKLSTYASALKKSLDGPDEIEKYSLRFKLPLKNWVHFQAPMWCHQNLALN